MTYADWKIKVRRLATCSCDYGCPCEFNAKPTHLPCEGVEAFEIVDGHYAGLPLSGLRIAGVYHWPGPASPRRKWNLSGRNRRACYRRTT